MNHIYKISFYLFLLAIIFFRLPNIYIFPDANSGLFTSQGIARIIISSIFFGSFLIFHQKDLLKSRYEKFVVFLLLGFLMCTSLSLIWASNIEAFWSRYKDVVIGIMSFFVFYLFKDEKKKIIVALLITIPLNLIYQSILLYGNSLYLMLESFIYQKHFDLVQYNLYRNRLYIEVYDEAFIPLLALLLDKKKKILSIFVLITLLFISGFAYLSNFRTRIVMLMLGIFSSFAFIQKFSFSRMLVLFICFIVLTVVANFMAENTWRITFYDRFLLSNERQDINTIISRQVQFKTSLQMGFLSPFGVGLGNYYEMLTWGKQSVIVNIPGPGWFQSSANQYIHNNFALIIAESGYIAFSFYLLLMIVFFIKDIAILKEKDVYKKSFVISFWLLFFFGLFNPPIPGTYQFLFWGIRGLLT